MEKAFKKEFDKPARAAVKATLNARQREYFDLVMNGKQRPSKLELDHWQAIAKAAREANPRKG